MTDTAQEKATPTTASANEDAPDGYHWEWIPDDAFAVTDLGRKCRMLRCPNKSVAMLKRQRRNSPFGFTWWHYCAEHLYGRKIIDGVVKSKRLIENSDSEDSR